MWYVWFFGSFGLLVIWFIVYLSLRDKKSKKEMFLISLWTSLLGLTEPLFVPEYWNPPSLFNLAQRTGFDIESLIFAFAVGGLAAVIYELIFKAKHEEFSLREIKHPRHKFHLPILFSSPLIFVLLWLFTDLNSIYSTSIALLSGGLLTWYCRPDLKQKMAASAFIFLAIYFLSFLILVNLRPNYVKEVWNLPVISGILILGIPLEELIFAFSLGFLWSSVYEHIKWSKIKIKVVRQE